MNQARIAIWINRKKVPQGKLFQKDGRWIYLANITDAKWFRNYSGYAISAQVLEMFTKAKIRPRIIYNLFKKKMKWETNKTKFYKKGILVSYGGHRQWILPLINKNWKDCKEDLNEPFGLPTLDVNTWLSSDNFDRKVSIKQEVMLRLRDEFYKKYPKSTQITY